MAPTKKDDRFPERAPAGSVLSLGPEGLALRTRARTLEAPWSDVLGALAWPPRDPTRVFVLIDRSPPRPPWIELPARALPEGLSPAALVHAVEERTAATTYRDGGPRPRRLAPEQLLAAVLAREPVPGAVEIPPARGDGLGPLLRFLPAAGGASVAAALLGAGIATTGAVGVIAGGVSWLATDAVRRRRPGARVLVLTPDGCVLGLPEGPTPLAWSDVASFSVSSDDTLVVTRRGDGAALRMPGRAFDQPVGLIAGIAEAYRTRWLR